MGVFLRHGCVSVASLRVGAAYPWLYLIVVALGNPLGLLGVTSRLDTPLGRVHSRGFSDRDPVRLASSPDPPIYPFISG